MTLYSDTFRRKLVKRRPSRILILDTILYAIWLGSCVGLGAMQ